MGFRFYDEVKKRSPILILIALWLLFFWPMLSGRVVCGFRDSAYFYFPLFQWIDQVWASGEWPLWNPYDGAGLPVVGDGSSSVFYPGKLIFLLRYLSYPTRYGWFLAAHVLLASFGAYWLSRQLGHGRWAAVIAGVAYGFGAPLLTQVSNCIYLIGNAWLPFALGAAWNVVRTAKWKWAVFLAICLAMLFLGGDPQTAYHALLIVGICLIAMLAAEFQLSRRVWQSLGWRSVAEEQSVKEPLRITGWAQLIGLFVSAVSLAILISAIQLLPTWEWSTMSERSIYSHPRNIFEVLGDPDFEMAGLVSKPTVGTHHHDLYEFSLPPWTLFEMWVPNGGGKMYPANSRFVDALPGADRVWYPSLYMGVLIVVLFCCGVRFKGRDRISVGLTWLTLLFAVGSFGWYGAPWLLRELNIAECGDVGSQVGGVYWLFLTFLPKYVLFRYPAKLFLVASLLIALLASRTGQSIFEKLEGNANGFHRSVRTIRLAAFSFGLAAGFGFLGVCCGQWLGILTAENLAWTSANEYGSCDVDTGIGCLRSGLLQSFLVLIFASRLMAGRSRFPTATMVPLLIVGLASTDILLANRWVLADVPVEHFQQNPKDAGVTVGPESKPPKIEQVAGTPDDNEAEFSPLIRAVRGYYRNLIPKTHLPNRIVAYDTFASIESVWETRLDELEQKLPRISLRRGADRELFEIQGGKLKIDRQFVGDEVAYRSFVEAEISQIAIENREQHSSGKWEIVAWERERVELRILNESSDSLYLCLRDTWVPGWEVTIAKETGELTNAKVEPWLGQFRAIEIPPGESQVAMSYRPLSLVIGFWCSLFGSLIAVGGLLLSLFRNRS